MSRSLLLGLLCLVHCAAPIDAPSAFSEERYLCDAEHIGEFDALVEQCREQQLLDGSCAGYLSFRGLIDSQPVVLDAPVTTAAYVEPTERAPGVGRQLTLRAQAPYFGFLLELRHFAIPPERSTSGLICGADGQIADVACDLGGDPSANSTGELLNLEARGGNFLSLLTSQWREIQIETPDEMRVAVTANLVRGGYIEGCFDVFPRPASAAP